MFSVKTKKQNPDVFFYKSIHELKHPFQKILVLFTSLIARKKYKFHFFYSAPPLQIAVNLKFILHTAM